MSLLLALETSLQDSVTERIAFLKSIQRTHSNDYWANQRLGYVLTTLGKHGEAIGYYQAAVAVEPGSAFNRNNLGRVLAEVGRREEAVMEYRRAIELDPLVGPIHCNLVLELCALGRWDDALIHLPTAIRFQPNSAILHTAYGICLRARVDTTNPYASSERRLRSNRNTVKHRRNCATS